MIDETWLEGFGFDPITDRFYRYVAVRGGQFSSDDFYEGYETRIDGFVIDGAEYLFKDMPLLEEGINHVPLPEEVDTPEFREILKDLIPTIPNFEEFYLTNGEE